MYKSVKNIFPIFAGVIIGVVVSVFYFTKLKPIHNKQADFPVLQNERYGITHFSCKPIQSATIFPLNNLADPNFVKVEGSLSSGDASSIAIDVGEKTIKFLTNTSVENGMLEPAEFTIMKNNDVRLIAVGVSVGSLKDVSSVNTFILDKKTGASVWTKASESSLIPDIPNGQAYYYNCN